MAVVSIAITLSFHVKHQPSAYELRIAKPLGALFWALSVLMLGLGLGNYISTATAPSRFTSPCVSQTDGVPGTVNQYSRRTAIVQTGWKTQVILGILATCIVATCVILILIERTNSREQSLLGLVI